MTNRQEAVAALHAVMDARALNLEQTSLLLSSSDDAHCLALHIAGLFRLGVDVDTIGDLTGLCRELAESNAREGDAELTLAAICEAFIARQLSETVEHRATVKSLANRLRPALRIIDAQRQGIELDGIAYFQACCQVRDVIAQTTPGHLLAPSMRHELRDRGYRLLCDLIEALAIEESA